MKRGRTMLICTLAGAAVCTTANAVVTDTSGSPYQGIIERNVFGLKAPPPPPDPEANKPPPPKIFLQGITTILGNKRALLKTQIPPKPGEPPKGDQGFILAEGQRDGEIEVLEIDAKAGKVKVKNYGQIVDLDFEKDGVKVAAAAPAPGGPPKPGGFVPTGAPNPFAPAGGANPIPTARPMRLPTPGGAVSSAAPGSATPVYAGGRSVPSGVMPGMAVGGISVPLSGSTAAQTQPQTAPSPLSQLSAEQQFLLVEAERARLQQQQAQGINLNFPPIPPTPLTRELNPDPTPTPTPTPTQTVPGLPRAPSLPQLPPASL